MSKIKFSVYCNFINGYSIEKFIETLSNAYQDIGIILLDYEYYPSNNNARVDKIILSIDYTNIIKGLPVNALIFGKICGMQGNFIENMSMPQGEFIDI